MFDMEKKEKSKVRDPLTFSKEMEDALLEDFAPSGVESPGMTMFVVVIQNCEPVQILSLKNIIARGKSRIY